MQIDPSKNNNRKKIPEEQLMIAVFIQALKDYKDDHRNRRIIRQWVNNMAGTFDMCASAIGTDMETLKKITLDKLDRIDNGESLNEFNYCNLCNHTYSKNQDLEHERNCKKKLYK